MIVPSYVAKVARAKKHLVDLEAEIGRYIASHPYTVSKTVQGKKQRTVYRLAFTASPANTDIPIIAADVIYNLRSSLDHLMSCLVPSNQRNSAIFPIYFQGVWESCVPGENPQRAKERSRWASDTKGLPAEAVAVLKAQQPPDASPQGDEVHLVRLVNRLSNRDRHEKLPVVAAGLSAMEAEITKSDGTVLHGVASTGSSSILENDAQIHDIPNDAVDVKIQGVPVVGIRLGQTHGYVRIPDQLRLAATHIEDRIFPNLAPFIVR